MRIKPKLINNDKNYKRKLRTQIEHLQTKIQVFYLNIEFDGNIQKISDFTGLARNTIYKILEDEEFIEDVMEMFIDNN